MDILGTTGKTIPATSKDVAPPQMDMQFFNPQAQQQQVTFFSEQFKAQFLIKLFLNRECNNFTTQMISNKVSMRFNYRSENFATSLKN